QLHDVAAAGQRVCGHRGGGETLAPRPLAARQRDGDLDRIAAFTAMRIADRRSGEQRLDRVVDVLLLHAEIFERVLIDGDAQTRAAVTETVVDIDDIGYVLENRAHAPRHIAPR